MASNGQSQTGGFEDQLRRMILDDGQSSVASHNAVHQGQPVVRLPPSSSHRAQQSLSNGSPMHSRDATAYPLHQRYTISTGNQYGQGPPSIHQAAQSSNRGISHRTYYSPHERPHQHQQSGFPHMMQPQHGSNVQQRARYQQPMALDPNAFHRNSFGNPFPGRGGRSQELFNPNQPRIPPVMSQADRHVRQAQYLEQVASFEIRRVDMSSEEHVEKKAFCKDLEKICHEVCVADPERLPNVSLEPFGSFQSGFATAGSDMDLVIVVKGNDSTSACFSLLEDDLPRALERRLLQLGYGARLLTRTRVPILKVCEKPGSSFLDKLRQERWKWDDLPNEMKYPHLHAHQDELDDVATEEPNTAIVPTKDTPQQIEDPKTPIDTNVSASKEVIEPRYDQDMSIDGADPINATHDPESACPIATPAAVPGAQQDEPGNSAPQQDQKNDTKREEKPWTRERKAGPLDFPKVGIGIQSDINFFNPLGLHNTQLLRCYSLCDPRVRPMVLFVKAWAKKRKINSSYSGTLSSYGYVLMVLHYLVNVANPPVLPNLQAKGQLSGHGETVGGYDVRFWRNESDIGAAAHRGQLTSNCEPLGSLLAGFFHYYSSISNGPSVFHWMQEVLSLRSPGGILHKAEKGWTKAVTEESVEKRVQHRYLFCIEDPFELDHNVARTVTHRGIVAIRDEFRRASRILFAVGNGNISHEGELFADLIEVEDSSNATVELKKANGVLDGTVKHSQDTSTAEAAAVRTKTANRRASSSTQNHPNPTPHQNAQRGKRLGSGPPVPAKALNVHDVEAFPTLGAAKPSKKKGPSAREAGEEFSEISGAKAKAHLAEVKRMKDEAQAESTAKGAAEAVLDGID